MFFIASKTLWFLIQPVTLIFLLLAFVARAPVLAGQAVADPTDPLPQRLFAAGLGLLATIPLWYGVAAISHLVARMLGGRGSHYGARLALFWALELMAWKGTSAAAWTRLRREKFGMAC